MAYNIQLLKADIADGLVKIDNIIKEFIRIKGKIDLPPDQAPNYDRGAIGYLCGQRQNTTGLPVDE